MSSDSSLAPGTQWRLRRGQHKGSIVEIEGLTFAGSVKMRTVEAGAKAAGKDYTDESQTHALRREQFLTLYEPVNEVRAATGAENGVLITQPRFRQTNPKRPRLAEEPVVIHQPSSSMQVSLETITPDLAEAWLERGGINRHLSEARVSKLTAALRRGEWQITGDSIKLDAEGKVRDGQHRLQAVVESGVPIQTLVVRNVAEHAFDVMDTGRSRSISDVLSIHGHKSIYGLQAAIRNLMLIEHTGRIVESTRESRELITTVTALEYVREHPEVEEGVRLGDTVRLVMAGGHGLWGAMLTLFLRVDHERTYEFQDKLVNGEGLVRGDPILILRNHQLAEMRQYVTRDANQKEMLGATIIKAWNLWRKGDSVDTWAKLAWKPGREPFPSAE